MEKLSLSKKQGWLSWFLKGLLILGLVVLIGRLGELQIIKGDYFRSLSDDNRLRRIPIPAPRGRILASDGTILVGNSEVKKKINFFPKTGYEFSDDITGANGDEIISDWVRDYKYGKSLAHVTGYLGPVNPSELGKIDPNCPERGPRQNYDLVGRGGLEAWYNCTLTGTDGEELIEVNTAGKKVRIIGRREPIPGDDIYTTIDLGLQQKAYEALGDKKSAAIITDTKGNILALTSAPSFDPNDFVGNKNNQNISSYFANPDLPLFNRAISGVFHPGSVFKPVVAIAALQEDKIDQNYTFNDVGQIQVNTFTYSNWYFTQYGKTEGEIGLTRAIARSTDTFFYKVGELTGIDALASWANKFGMGSKTGIDLPGEANGLVPTPDWKKKVKGEPWFLGNTYNVSIGQGDLAITPLEENMAISAIAANGIYCYPHINANVGTKCINLNIAQKNIDLVKAGMSGACEQGGTGYTFFDFTPTVACKTGTAETSQDGKTHAWFTLFAPVDEAKPEIVMTVVVEHGGEGSAVAGPIARTIMDFWKSRRP